MANVSVSEPFPIFKVANHYLLYDVDTVAYIRRKYQICGVLIGTIPHLSQQNVFLGLPLELMPEEARLLVEKGVAYVIDDVKAHQAGILGMTAEEKAAFMQVMDTQGYEAARTALQKQMAKKEKHMKEIAEKRAKEQEASEGDTQKPRTEFTETEADGDTSLFAPPTTSLSSIAEPKVEKYFVTPATSYPPLVASPDFAEPELPLVPGNRYPLFAYLHSNGYFMTPGLRFGCNYTVYPGDPLRFHSHFLATGLDWNEEFDLLDIVGGGRLGTAVKKAYLIGGKDPAVDSTEKEGLKAGHGVRAFSIEWASM